MFQKKHIFLVQKKRICATHSTVTLYTVSKTHKNTYHSLFWCIISEYFIVFEIFPWDSRQTNDNYKCFHLEHEFGWDEQQSLVQARRSNLAPCQLVTHQKTTACKFWLPSDLINTINSQVKSCNVEKTWL